MDPIGVVTVGYSLARTLNTYISDVKGANDDITSLISDIEATLGQLNDLVKLIDKNKTTNAWSEDGLRNAQKCVTDCEKIITKLRALLKKSTASATSEELNRDDIDVSKLEQAFWPFNKPKMEVHRKELQSLKQDISIAHTSYMMHIGPDAERKKFKDDLPRLKKTRAIARRQVREAKEKRRKHTGYGNSNAARRPHTPREIRSDDDRGSVSGDSRHIYYDEDDLESLFEDWKAEEEEKRLYAKVERDFVQQEAVNEWKAQQLHEVEVRQQRIDNERSSLRIELKKQNLAPQQIEDILNHVHPHEMKSDSHLLSIAIASDNASSTTTNDSPAKAALSRPRRGLIWPKKRSNSSHYSSKGATLANEAQETPVPGILKDPTAEGGIAPLKARYFQRSGHALDGIHSFNVDIPGPWLIDSLIKKQEMVARDSKKSNSVWQEYSLLPEDYQFAISEYITTKLAAPGEETTTWVLLHLESVRKRRHRGLFNRNNRGEIVGVYLVLKQEKRSRNLSGGLEDDISNIKLARDRPTYEYIVPREPSRRHDSDDIHAQRGPTNSGYNARRSSSFRDSIRESTSRPQRLEPNGDYPEGHFHPGYPQPQFGAAQSPQPRIRPNLSFDHARTYNNPGPWLYPQEKPMTQNLAPPAPFMSGALPAQFPVQYPDYLPPPGSHHIVSFDSKLPHPISSPSKRRDHSRFRSRQIPLRRSIKYRRSWSRSPSPGPLRRSETDESWRSVKRPLRRSGTDETYRSVDSTASATRIRRPLRSGHRREEIIIQRRSHPPLSVISESSDSSTGDSDASISSVASDIDDKSDPVRDPSHERLRNRPREGRPGLPSRPKKYEVANPIPPKSTAKDVEKGDMSLDTMTNGHEEGTMSKALILKPDA